MSPVDLKNPGRPLHVGVILIGRSVEILDVAPIDLLHGLTKSFTQNFPPNIIDDAMRAEAMDIEFHWITETGKDPARLTSGIKIVPTDSYASCPPLDVVLIGAWIEQYEPTAEDDAFVRKAYNDCTAFLTICGGYEAALHAGLLDGKTATAPRLILEHLRQGKPETKWVEKRYVRDGKMWTSGTLLNGLDLMKAFVLETWGGQKGGLAERVVGIGSWPERAAEYPDTDLKLGMNGERL